MEGTTGSSTGSSDSSVIQFANISLSGNPESIGIFKINKLVLNWKSKAGSNETVDGSLLQSANWVRIGRILFCLELKLKNGSIVKFEGFKDPDFQPLQKALQQYFSIELQTVPLSTKGTNWGSVEFQGSTVSFVSQDSKKVFELPLADVSRGAMPGGVGAKNDVMLEFMQEDETDNAQSLMEIRFHIPEVEGEDKMTAARFLEKVLSKADMSTSGKGLVLFNEVPFATPRGRYNVEMYPTFMKLYGKTNDYKISYKKITRLFEFPKPDKNNVFFVISLDPPIKQGQTRYHHLVLAFSKDEEVDGTVTLTKETAEKYKKVFTPLEDGKLKGAAHTVISKVFKELTEKKVTMPHSFSSVDGASAIRCSLKANDGFLYPLERSFFFVHKPPTHIKFEDILEVEFARVSSSNSSGKTFDLVVSTKGGIFQFTSIQRNEYEKLITFLDSKNVQTKTTTEVAGATVELAPILQGAQDDSDEEDEDFEAPDEEEVPEEFESSDEDFDEDEDEDSKTEPSEMAESPMKDVTPDKKRKSDKGESEPKEKKAKKSSKEKKEKKEKKHKKDKKKEKKEKSEKRDKSEKKKKEHKEKKPKSDSKTE